MAMLISLHRSDQSANSGWSDSADDAELQQHSHEILLQLNAASDQHAALAEELDSLAAIAPCDFSPEQLFALVRAIRVQSRVLNMYLGPEQVGC